jgi:hypothetical protein
MAPCPMHFKHQTDMTTDFKLTREEARSPLWKKLAPFIEREIAEMREANDSLTLSIADTTAKRGAIRFAKQILALADEAGQEARQSEADGPESAFLPPQGG